MPDLRPLMLALSLAFAPCIGLAAGQDPPPEELRLIAARAAQFDHGAELLYGLAWLEGRYNLEADPARAAYWLRRAARGGHAYAQMMLGRLYAEGRGLARDPVRAVYWWRQAARGQNAEAQFLLGRARLEGEGVPRDPERAVHWLTRAAEKGQREAGYLLGKMYYEGYQVPQDLDLSRDWLQRAAHRQATPAPSACWGSSILRSRRPRWSIANPPTS